MNALRNIGSAVKQVWDKLCLRISDLRGNFRILYGAGAVIALLLVIIVLNLVGVKKVELIVDGNSEIVKTRTTIVQDFLAEQGISIGEHDVVSVALTDRVDEHARIEVAHAVQITLESDHELRQLYTTASNVGEALQQAGIKIGELDRVEPGLQHPITSGEQIRVIRVEKRTETDSELIPYEIVTRQDPTILKGKEKVVQEGRAGKIEHVYERIYEDGRLIEEKLIDSNVLSYSEDEIVAVGTRSEVAILSAASPDIQTVTKDGVTFGVKKIIEATLTAYEAGPQSTGKTEDHPYYGITYTGTVVEEGRTAAVDPDVIPLGWWIYIEDYGFRRAEDKGSGVKGNWVDIYYDSLETAEKFGKKKGTVYIIGPDHPLGE